MAIPSRQIGWGTEENLLWQISKQLETLTKVVYNIPNNTTSTTTTLNPNCIYFTANTTLGGTTFVLNVAVSENISCTVVWGDGSSEQLSLLSGNQLLEHTYPNPNTAYNATLCFSDATKVTVLDFWGND